MGPQTGLDLHGVIKTIEGHCQAVDTGTLFLVTDRNETIKLVFIEGEVTALSFQSVRGAEALTPIGQLVSCKPRFYPGVKLLPLNQTLPATRQILDTLAGRDHSDPGEETFVETTIVAQDAEQGPQLTVSLAELRDILVEEATEFLGPFARVLCSKYLLEVRDPPRQMQLQEVLDQLAKDIRNQVTAQELAHRVQARIR